MEASDEDPRVQLKSRAKVKINLIDVNDSPPEFTSTILKGEPDFSMIFFDQVLLSSCSHHQDLETS